MAPGVQRDNKRIVLVLASGGLPFFGKQPDHPKRHVPNPDFAANWIEVGKQLFSDRLSQKRDLVPSGFICSKNTAAFRSPIAHFEIPRVHC